MRNLIRLISDKWKEKGTDSQVFVCIFSLFSLLVIVCICPQLCQQPKSVCVGNLTCTIQRDRCVCVCVCESDSASVYVDASQCGWHISKFTCHCGAKIVLWLKAPLCGLSQCPRAERWGGGVGSVIHWNSSLPSVYFSSSNLSSIPVGLSLCVSFYFSPSFY